MAEQRSPSLDIHRLSKTIKRYLAKTAPEKARIATDGNAHIIMYLAGNKNRDIFQYNIEDRFCISRSTASRVLALMEKKGLITRDSCENDARVKKIALTQSADAIVEDLERNAQRMERKLFKGFSAQEQEQFEAYLQRLRENIASAEEELTEDTNQAQPDLNRQPPAVSVLGKI